MLPWFISTLKLSELKLMRGRSPVMMFLMSLFLSIFLHSSKPVTAAGFTWCGLEASGINADEKTSDQRCEWIKRSTYEEKTTTNQACIKPNLTTFIKSCRVKAHCPKGHLESGVVWVTRCFSAPSSPSSAKHIRSLWLLAAPGAPYRKHLHFVFRP